MGSGRLQGDLINKARRGECAVAMRRRDEKIFVAVSIFLGVWLTP
uniref:Uncharacterized protein n=1 Tax=Escherichia coli TaxID=562 RepID=A0A6G6AM52_ECOLX|nr:hypothetical protein [Escherichia coli]QID23421.1 hypothetical protein [Escherichia coli]